VTPTFEELMQLAGNHFTFRGNSHGDSFFATELIAKTDPATSLEQFARAVLARWGRAVLAQPEPVGVTDEELMEQMPQHVSDDFAAAARALAGPGAPKAVAGACRVGLNRNAVDFARAVLARYGHPALAPIPVSEGLPEPVGPTDLPPVQETAPERIWLHLNGANEWLPFKDEEGVVWSPDQIDESDIPYVRVDLARWGRVAIAPIPVSERLPGAEDCDAEGRLYAVYKGRWFQIDLSCIVEGGFTHWLPTSALPLPEGGAA
jgi:hypothetical protein